AGHDPAEVLRGAVQGRSLDDATSVAQVLAHRISAGHSLAAATPQPREPERLPDAHLAYLREWQERAGRREAELGTRTAQEAPAWATRHLGPVPDDAVERLEWEAKAGRIAGYREAAGFDD